MEYAGIRTPIGVDSTTCDQESVGDALEPASLIT
jgi:hypothetical protein